MEKRYVNRVLKLLTNNMFNGVLLLYNPPIWIRHSWWTETLISNNYDTSNTDLIKAFPNVVKDFQR